MLRVRLDHPAPERLGHKVRAPTAVPPSGQEVDPEAAAADRTAARSVAAARTQRAAQAAQAGTVRAGQVAARRGQRMAAPAARARRARVAGEAGEAAMPRRARRPASAARVPMTRPILAGRPMGRVAEADQAAATVVRLQPAARAARVVRARAAAVGVSA